MHPLKLSLIVLLFRGSESTCRLPVFSVTASCVSGAVVFWYILHHKNMYDLKSWPS